MENGSNENSQNYDGAEIENANMDGLSEANRQPAILPQQYMDNWVDGAWRHRMLKRRALAERKENLD